MLYSLAKTVYLELKPLFTIDPLLLPNLLHLCPRSEYMSLFEVIPPFYSISELAYQYQFFEVKNIII